MADNIHVNGSWLGDSVEEFKKLPTAGKVGIGALLIGVAVYAYMHRQSATAQSSVSPSMTGTPGSGSTMSAGAQSPFPMVGNVPVLPSGTNPIYGPGGDLTGYQQSPPPTSSPTPSGGPLLSQLPSGFKWQFGQTVNVNGTTYTVGPGNNGRLWGVPGTGMSLQQFNNTPIAPGGKVLVYQGQSGAGPGVMIPSSLEPYQPQGQAGLSTLTLHPSVQPAQTAAILALRNGNL